MDYSVGKIPATYSIDPDKHGTEKERKKGRLFHKTADSICISDEARQRSADAEAEENTQAANEQPDQEK